MNSDKRITRPLPERTGPLRNWSTLFAPWTAAAPAATGAAPGADGGALGDVVTRSVELGYRVIDEYIRQGQRAAQRLNQPAYGAQTMAGDVQDLAMRLTNYASDLAAVWLQLVQLAAAGTPTANPTNGAAAPEAAPAAAPAETAASHDPAPAAARVRVAVRAAQPTEVAVDIHPDATARPLIAHALRAGDAVLPRLDDVSFEPATDGGTAVLRIHVPPGHPAGVYEGMLIDEQSNRPVGTVSVTVLP
jgi:hypothetical protein